MNQTVKQDAPMPPPVVPHGLPVPAPPMPDIRPEDIPVFKGVKGRYLKTVLSQEEFAIYVEVWVDIMRAYHQSFTDPFDLIDVAAICMETVVQMRLLRTQKSKPKQYDATAYASSVRRMAAARENLSSRRSDRMGKNARSQVNVAVMVSNMGTPESIALRQQEQKMLLDQEESMLLVRPEPPHQVKE